MDTSIWDPMPIGPRLNGRKIIVTGAASGMGRAIARLFRHEGASVALFDVDATALKEAAAGLDATAITVDVSVPEAVSRAVAQAETAMHGIDGVVNAAGILRVASFADTEPETWRRIHEVNLFGPYLVCRAALPALSRNGSAAIVNIASMGGIKTPPNMSAYGASKAGLIALTQGMALELAPKIRANSICPGIIKTPMTDALWSTNPAQGEEMSRSHVVLQRKGTPMEVAYLALYLISSESSFVTGSVYTINGGLN